MKFCFLFSILLLSFIPIALFAQNDVIENEDVENDTVIQSRNVKFYTEESIDISFFADSIKFDTVMSGFQKMNPAFNEHFFYASPSNIGMFSKDLIYNMSDFSMFSNNIEAYDVYLTDFSDVKYYSLESPFSEMYYTNLFGTHELFNVKLYQNLGENVNLGFRYNTMGGPGQYLNQSTRHNNFLFNTSMQSRNKRYILLTAYIYNQVKASENGGIRNDSIFEENIETNRDAIGVYLSTAKHDIVEHKCKLKQYFLLNKNPNDSTRNMKWNLGTISHSFVFESSKRMYSSSTYDTLFYPTIYADSSYTFDSINIRSFSNELMWSNRTYSDTSSLEKKLFLYVKVKHDLTRISDSLTSNDFNHLCATAGFDYKIVEDIHLSASCNYVIGDYSNNDYRADVCVYRKKQESLYGFSLSQYMKTASWFESHYTSNHFMWNNSWQQKSYSKLSIFYNIPKLKSSLSAYRFDNYLFYNEYALPEQEEDAFLLLQADISSSFKFGKAWETSHRMVYQKTLNSDVLRLPDFQYRGSLYYSFSVFDKALRLQPGIDLHFLTAYYADAYMPATAVFYMQNDKKIEEQLYIDVFVNFKIKRARMFLKYSHVNAGLLGYNYYSIPGYPMHDRIMQFGISWMFYD